MQPNKWRLIPPNQWRLAARAALYPPSLRVFVRLALFPPSSRVFVTAAPSLPVLVTVWAGLFPSKQAARTALFAPNQCRLAPWLQPRRYLGGQEMDPQISLCNASLRRQHVCMSVFMRRGFINKMNRKQLLPR